MTFAQLTTESAERTPKTVAYLMSRFPKITETFILYEILELQRLGMQVEVFPLVHQQEQLAHPEAQQVVEQAHYSSVLSGKVVAAQAYWLLYAPQAYIKAWAKALWGNRSSPKFLLRALAVVLQAAWFARDMQRRGVAHVHAHWATHPTLAAYVVHALTGLPYSFTAHAHDIYVERPMLEAKLHHASFAVTISEYNRRLLHELYGDEANKTVVIHCGIDPAVFQPRPARPQGNPLKIVCVASLQDYKGHTYLIEACARLKAQGIAFQCVCAGEGEERPHLEAQIAALGLGNEITLLGHQTRGAVSQLLAEADAVVQPSVTLQSGKQEGIPVALMEALATELPVVATAISGVPELIENGVTGLLVPERNAEALAAALARLAREPELGHTLGAAGRTKVLSEFNLLANSAALHRLLMNNWGASDTSPFFEPSVAPTKG